MIPRISPRTCKPLFFIILVAFLVGCVSESLVVSDGDSALIVTNAPSPTSTSSPIPMPSETPTPIPTETPIPTIQPTASFTREGQVTLGEEVIFDMAADDLGCFGIGELSYAPTKEYFLVVLQCFEDDNEIYLFQADGSGGTRITGPWDYLNYYNYEWAPDGLSFLYYRINSCCVPLAEIPPEAPPEGLVRYELLSGIKTSLASPTPAVTYYKVINVASNDVLNIRSEPDPYTPIVGTIPHDGINVQITGEGVTVGYATWMPVLYEGITGWVSASFLLIQVQP